MTASMFSERLKWCKEMILCGVKLIRFHAANQEIKLSFEILVTKFVTNLVPFHYLLVFHAAFN